MIKQSDDKATATRFLTTRLLKMLFACAFSFLKIERFRGAYVRFIKLHTFVTNCISNFSISNFHRDAIQYLIIICNPTMDLIDTHVHLCHPSLPYSWLKRIFPDDNSITKNTTNSPTSPGTFHNPTTNTPSTGSTNNNPFLTSAHCFHAISELVNRQEGRSPYDNPNDSNSSESNNSNALHISGSLFIETGVDQGHEIDEALYGLRLCKNVRSSGIKGVIANVPVYHGKQAVIDFLTKLRTRWEIYWVENNSELAVSVKSELNTFGDWVESEIVLKDDIALLEEDFALMMKNKLSTLRNEARGFLRRHLKGARCVLHVPGSPDPLSSSFVSGVSALSSEEVLTVFDDIVIENSSDSIILPTTTNNLRLPTLKPFKLANTPDKAQPQQTDRISLLFEICVYGHEGLIVASELIKKCTAQNDANADTPNADENDSFSPLPNSTKFILDHCGFIGTNAELFTVAMKQLAKNDNLLAVKLSGMEEWRTPEDTPVLHWVDVVINILTCSRVVCGSNWFLSHVVPEAANNVDLSLYEAGFHIWGDEKDERDGIIELAMTPRRGDKNKNDSNNSNDNNLPKKDRLKVNSSKSTRQPFFGDENIATNKSAKSAFGDPNDYFYKQLSPDLEDRCNEHNKLQKLLCVNYCAPFDYVRLSLDRLGASSEDRRKVFSENAKRVFGI